MRYSNSGIYVDIIPTTNDKFMNVYLSKTSIGNSLHIATLRKNEYGHTHAYLKDTYFVDVISKHLEMWSSNIVNQTLGNSVKLCEWERVFNDFVEYLDKLQNEKKVMRALFEY